jgi:hypothetical protein
MIHLEDTYRLSPERLTIRECIEPSTQDHVLARTTGCDFLEHIFGESVSDYEGCASVPQEFLRQSTECSPRCRSLEVLRQDLRDGIDEYLRFGVDRLMVRTKHRRKNCRTANFCISHLRFSVI